jgi:exo-beta-1,3-glucanase (GH17 family)
MPAINAREIEGVIAVARAGHADIVAVGNEVLLREDISEDALIERIEYVKRSRCPVCRWAMSTPTSCSSCTRA